jgi:hypothetical protein
LLELKKFDPFLAKIPEGNMADEPMRKQQWAAERQRVAQTLFYEASRTPAQRLLAASEDGDVASVAALLQDGVDVDVREQDGWVQSRGTSPALE